MESLNVTNNNLLTENNDASAAGDRSLSLSSSSSSSSLSSFLYVLPNPDTQEDYLIRLGYFFDFLRIPGDNPENRADRFLELEQDKQQPDHKWAKDCLTNYIDYLKNDTKRKLSGGSIKNYYATVKLFYEANAINLNWKWISRGLPASSHVANDRAPKLEEIRKLIEYPDRRIKVIVFVMVSSGIRVGAWNYLKYKHITPIKDEKTNQVIAAKMKVYDTLPDPYFTFITGEACREIQEYMDFRALHGEKITGESWLLRDKFDTTTDKNGKGAKRSLATRPKKLSVAGIKKILIHAMRSQGLRQPLEEGERRHEFKLAHGYRKFFKTNAERAGMISVNVEMLMNHAIGTSDNYYRPTEQQLQDDYIKIVDHLVINKDQKNANQLQKEVSELKEEREHDKYAIMGKLAEKEKETESMKKELEKIKAQLPVINRNFANLLMAVQSKLEEGEEFVLEQPDGSEPSIMRKSYPETLDLPEIDERKKKKKNE